jgi:hypothetical protein
MNEGIFLNNANSEKKLYLDMMMMFTLMTKANPSAMKKRLYKKSGLSGGGQLSSILMFHCEEGWPLQGVSL